MSDGWDEGAPRGADGRRATVLQALPGGGRVRVPPHDRDAEIAVLAEMILEPEAVGPLAEAALTKEDFYDPAHGVIFDAMLAVLRRREHLDVLTLAAELRARDRLNTIGGVQYLGEITDGMPTVAHAESHIALVADSARQRRMIFAAEQIALRGYQGGQSAAEFVQESVAVMDRATETRGGPKGLQPMSDVVGLTLTGLEATLARREATGQAIAGTTWGLRSLDRLTQGLHAPQLVIIGARPAMGKTSAALRLAVEEAKTTGRPVLFYSLEMSATELGARVLCMEARVDASRVKSGLLTQDDMTALTRAANTMAALPLMICDAALTRVSDIRATARKVKSQYGLTAIVIDYLQILTADRRDESREKEISEISRALKVLAKDLDVPVIALAQLNRSCETRPGKNKRPTLADLRESGSLEQDADVVVFIYRDEVYNKDTEDRGIAEFIIAKQRNGPVDTARARFVRNLTLFEDLDDDDPRYGMSSEFDAPPHGAGDDDIPSLRDGVNRP